MKTLSILYKIFIATFVLAEVGIYIAFNVLAFVGAPDPVWLKYSGILLCLAAALVSIFFCRGDGIVLSVALLFTAVSDLIIFVLDSYYEWGLTTFVIVQFVYLYRLYAGRLRQAFKSLAVRVLLIAAAIIALRAMDVLDYLTGTAAVYIIMLIANFAQAAHRAVFGGVKCALFAAGLALFICCDVCVGLNNFGAVLGITLPQGVMSFVSVAMWAFYAPSQVLIVCSAQKGGLSGSKGSKQQ